ncbi:unnamed protein product [Triticum turgidum subsp. durum]|uniref:Leishmanolysin-like peptidase n=1 Tax=Triticum turgidum subsp. durum TaxID=4567 RepID=A0A9R0SKQ1_TRITD|nr:unnamed protein product [Triticum turgidum subsp. durum]
MVQIFTSPWEGFRTNWFAFWISRGDLVDLARPLWCRVLLFRRGLSWARKGMFLPEELLFLGIWVAVRLVKADESKLAVFGWIPCCLPIQFADAVLTACGPVPLQGAAIVLILVWSGGASANSDDGKTLSLESADAGDKDVYLSHSCIHDEILHQRRRAGRKEYSVMPQVYHVPREKVERVRGRQLLGVSSWRAPRSNVKKPIRIYLNYDAVGHSPDRDCKNVGDIVKLGEPPVPSAPGTPICSPHGDPPLLGDCWYNCTFEDIAGEDKKQRLRKALGQTVEWFRKALAVEPVKGNLRLSGYSACGQDGGVQLPHAYIEDGVANADLVLLVTTRPTTGNTLAWAVACERDQWGRAIAGHVNVAPRHLTAEAETLLSATLIHEVMHVLGFDPHAFTHFRDERKRRRDQC